MDFGHYRLGFPIDTILYNSEFDLVHEAEDYVVVNKPAHLQVHPSTPDNPPTLLDGLRELLAFELASGGQLSIITRLDRETSGVVLVATTRKSARRFGLAMQRGEFVKTYLAIVIGWPEADEFVIDGPLLRKGTLAESPIWVKQCVHPDGKPALTSFKVLERHEAEIEGENRNFSLVECRPRTGRMHQIRVHLQHAGFPIVGDKIYGPDENCYLQFIETGWTAELQKRLWLPRHALHAWRLELGDETWEAPLQPELARILKASSVRHSKLPGGGLTGGVA